MVTAAHCFYEKPLEVIQSKLVACGDHLAPLQGSEVLGEDSHEWRMAVEEVIFHPSYRGIQDNYNNDVAIIRGSEQQELLLSQQCSQGSIWPACLPTKGRAVHLLCQNEDRLTFVS